MRIVKSTLTNYYCDLFHVLAVIQGVLAHSYDIGCDSPHKGDNSVGSVYSKIGGKITSRRNRVASMRDRLTRNQSGRWIENGLARTDARNQAKMAARTLH